MSSAEGLDENELRESVTAVALLLRSDRTTLLQRYQIVESSRTALEENVKTDLDELKEHIQVRLVSPRLSSHNLSSALLFSLLLQCSPPHIIIAAELGVLELNSLTVRS